MRNVTNFEASGQAFSARTANPFATSPVDAWALSRALTGGDANDHRDRLTGRVRRMVDHLCELPPAERLSAWNAMLAARDDATELVNAVAGVDPLAPAPEPGSAQEARAATLADLRRLVADTAWPWTGWLAGGVLNALAADPGTGKTILAMELARRLWHAEPWPDGGENPFPARSRTLWVPGDRHYPQLLDLAAAYGLPDEALLLNAPPEDPVAGLDLDDPATMGKLEARIASEAPALVVVDTVGMTTSRNLCRPEEARAYFSPLMDVAGRTGVAFLLLTHLSKEGEALGRRIVGACRTAWKLSTPDPEGQPDRRRLWVDKSYAVKPPPLGMTIEAAGCTFDFDPPSKPETEPRRPGPPSAKLAACKEWVREQLDLNPVRVGDLRREAESAGFRPGTLYAAKNVLEVEEFQLEGKKWWRLPPNPDKPF